MSLEEARRAARRAVHRAADQQSDRWAQQPNGYPVVGVVTTVTAAGAADGVTALVKVTWRGGETTAAGWNAAQTFAVGQPVLCHMVDNQLFVDFPIVGQP